MYARSLFNALQGKENVVAWVISGPSRSNFVRTVDWLTRGARKAIGSKPPDILHCPTFVAPWRVQVPVVVTAHDAATRRFPHDHPAEWRAYDRAFLGRRLRHAARVIAVSDFARREVIDAYGLDPDRVVAVPNGLQASFLDAGVSDLDPSGGPILFPGAPIGRKNLDGLLRVIAGAPRTSALGRASLEISGAEARDFPHYAPVIKASGLEGRVRWLGQLTPDELVARMRAASVVAYPSLYEGFGFPPLEAMALGTPVVASDRGSLPEVLGDAALLVDPTDDSALARALEDVLTRPELRERLRARGRKRARDFTWDKCADLTLDVYRSVLTAPRATAV